MNMTSIYPLLIIISNNNCTIVAVINYTIRFITKKCIHFFHELLFPCVFIEIYKYRILSSTRIERKRADRVCIFKQFNIVETMLY